MALSSERAAADKLRRERKETDMRRIKLVLAYDGTNYCGWQFQSNGVTIEQVLNEALTALLGEPVAVLGASRTDSGVHALGNVAVFDTESRMAADKICLALNQRLPDDIRALSSEEVAPDWHPRKQNSVKTYEYRILNRKVSIPTQRLYAYFCYFPLDVEKMRLAAEYLVGEHDFRSFCSPRGQSEETVRTVYSLDICREGDMIVIRVSGNGFLYNMVRIMAGTLMKIGMGVYPPEHIEEILDARDRKAAGPTAPAKGLTLMEIRYEKELRERISACSRDWSYELIQREIPFKKKAYLIIERCEERDFDRLLMRVTHQAMRNGAREVFVSDRSSGIMEGKSYGYYVFHHDYDIIRMAKTADASSAPYVPGNVLFEKLTEEEIPLYCGLVNRVFCDVPGSASLVPEQVESWMREKGRTLLLLRLKNETAGFLDFSVGEEEAEIHYVGILPDFRRKGAGGEALRYVESAAAAQDVRRVSLLAASTNLPAGKLYERAGFQAEETVSRWYKTTWD